MLRIVAALIAWVLLSAQTPMLPGFPPGTFQSRAALDAGSAPAGLPLDGVSNVKVAYSTRQLRTAYAGFAMRLQETNGLTTQDIGFVANVLDTSAVATFCSGKTCIINIWYDQSGNGNDAAPLSIQLNEAPVIYTAGAFKAINGKPAAFWDTAASPANRLITTVTGNPVNTLYVNSVVNLTNTSGGGVDNPISGISGFNAYVFNTKTSKLQVDKFGAGGVAISTNSITYVQPAIYENEWTLSTGAFSFWIDGTFSNSGTNLQTFSAANLDLGNAGGGSALTSGLQGEFIEIDQVGSFAGRAALQANQKAYWGTP